MAVEKLLHTIYLSFQNTNHIDGRYCGTYPAISNDLPCLISTHCLSRYHIMLSNIYSKWKYHRDFRFYLFPKSVTQVLSGTLI